MGGRSIAILGAVSALSAAALAQYAEGDEEIRKTVRENTVEPPVPNPIPDRLSIDRQSRYYTPHGGYVGVRLDGNDVSGRVVEFCVFEGWVRLADSPPGTKLTYQQVKDAQKKHGKVETFWRMEPSRQIRRQFARMT